MKPVVDVLVVGAGPTGSALAIDLARRGVRVRIIEKNAHSFPGSRAKGLQPRTLEVLSDFGVLDRIVGSSDLYPPLGVHVGPFVMPKRMYKNVQPTPGVPYPNTLLIAQYRTDAILHARLSELGVKVEFNTKLDSFEQDADAVHAKLQTPAGLESIDATYLVGADGGASSVREKLGIGFPGKTDASDRMIIVDSRVDGLSRNYWHAWPGMGGRFTIACPLPGGDLFQWMIRLQPDEEPKTDEASLNARIRQHTRNKKLRLYDIQWTSVFRPNIRLADRYAVGRIFLAGDAAHVHTPAGAQGLNTGIQDAYNLGWKLAQVIAGAPPQLLETYEAERQPVAARVLGMSTKKYEAMNKLDKESVARGKDEQQLLITYRFGPLASQGGGTTAVLAGDRAPDAIVRDGRGTERRLFEALRGGHFSAIAFGPDAARDLAKFRWPSAGAALKRISINGVADGQEDFIFTDPKSSFAKNYAAAPGMIFLIRPDGYIARIVTRDRIAELTAAASVFGPPLETAGVRQAHA